MSDEKDDFGMKKPFPWATILDWGWILTVTLASSLLLYSGWREMSPYNSPDIPAHQGNAIDLVWHGFIPYRGQGLSNSGWDPPGTSFLMVPGVLFMSDPRLIVLTIALFLPYRLDSSRIHAVQEYGYGGRENGQMQAVEWIAGKAVQDPARTFVSSVSRYGGGQGATRPWGWLQFGLNYVFVSPNTAISDLSPEDDSRILEFIDADLDRHPKSCPWDGYDLVWESRRYAICQRRS
jgi:hypothetical protein